MIEEHGIHSFANRVVTAEGKREVAHAAAHLGIRQIFLDPLHRPDIIHGIVVMLLDTGSDGQNVGVENNVFGRKVDFIHQQIISSFANGNFIFVSGCLSLFIESHHHEGCPVIFNLFGLFQKIGFPVFQTQRVDDSFPLYTFQSCFYHFPFGRVDHNG